MATKWPRQWDVGYNVQSAVDTIRLNFGFGSPVFPLYQPREKFEQIIYPKDNSTSHGHESQHLYRDLGLCGRQYCSTDRGQLR
jgi:hypothetical protein